MNDNANAIGVILGIVLLLVCSPAIFEIAVILLIGLSRASGKTLGTIGAVVVFGVIVALAAILR